jgi:(1->4)-alpha-D-glucan 1-alpha-D-glucosylmutase
MTGVDLAAELSGSNDDERIKLYLTCKALAFRKENRSLFEQGEYLPLSAVGSRADYVCTFARRTTETSMIVAVPRFLWRLVQENGSMPLEENAVWDDTYLAIPDTDRESHYRNIFTNETFSVGLHEEGKPGVAISGIFSSFPVALLIKTD